MKTKIFLTVALLGAAVLTANAGVRFGISIGLPRPIVVSPPVVCSAPVAPATVAVVQTIPPCPGVDYVWVAGYWSYLPTGRVWVPGAWQHRSAHVTYVNDRHDTYARHGGYNRNDRHDGHDRERGHNDDGYRR